MSGGALFSELAQALGYRHQGAECEITAAQIDTRKLQSGEVFFALRGEQMDGHDFVDKALEQGAKGVVVERLMAVDCPQLIVPSVAEALGQIAGYWRKKHRVVAIGVTGSNGKTTVKEMLTTVLSSVAPTLSTQGNFNNEIGLPLTVLRLRAHHRFAVFEMGANHPGEIARLVRIAQPQVAMINNVGRAHVEGFGSIEGVAQAKGEIYQGLSAEAVAVVNADDAFAPSWQALIGQRAQWRFAQHAEADVRVELLDGGEIGLHYQGHSARLTLALLGEHNARNAAAVTACALAAGLSFEQAVQALPSCRAYAGRLQRHQCGALQLIDDSYNANPDSVRSAIDTLARFEAPRVLVLGDMGELGEHAEALHAEVGAYAKACGIERLYCCGALTKHSAAAFGANATHFAAQGALIEAIEALGRASVLIKGSRSAAMDKVVKGVLERATG